MEGKSDLIDLPGLHRRQSCWGAGSRSAVALLTCAARGIDVLPAQTRLAGAVRGGGPAGGAERRALPGGRELARDGRGVRGGTGSDARRAKGFAAGGPGAFSYAADRGALVLRAGWVCGSAGGGAECGGESG